MGAVRVDESPDIAWDLGIQGVPTLILFNKGIEMQRFVGLQPENTLLDAMKELKGHEEGLEHRE